MLANILTQLMADKEAINESNLRTWRACEALLSEGLDSSSSFGQAGSERVAVTIAKTLNVKAMEWNFMLNTDLRLVGKGQYARVKSKIWVPFRKFW